MPKNGMTIYCYFLPIKQLFFQSHQECNFVQIQTTTITNPL